MLEKVNKVRELLTNNWTQRAMARDSEGKAVGPLSSDAVCWCLMGACAKVVNVPIGDDYIELCHLIGDTSNCVTLVSFNDCNTHEAVLDLLDNVIRRLEHA